jgi:signal transduction histidine kinase
MSTNADDQNLEIVIKDNGHGIPEGVSEKIRQPFYTTRQGRSGLGLPIAEGIIAAHGGRIDYESHADGGTRVRLVLPITNGE